VVHAAEAFFYWQQTHHRKRRTSLAILLVVARPMITTAQTGARYTTGKLLLEQKKYFLTHHIMGLEYRPNRDVVVFADIGAISGRHIVVGFDREVPLLQRRTR
jgi:hypothetical protein